MVEASNEDQEKGEQQVQFVNEKGPPQTLKSRSSSAVGGKPFSTFINITHPKQRRAKHIRRAVRSHVTTQQHIQKRDTQFKNVCLPFLGSYKMPQPEAFAHHYITDAFPESWQRDVSRTLHHMQSLVNVEIAEIDGTGVKGSIGKVLYPAVFSEQAAIRAVVLFGRAHHIRFCNGQYDSLNFLQLKSMALSSVNHAIQDGNTSDATIAAIANIASTEAMFGSPDVFHTHMLGLQGMVQARGGLDMLGIDGVLERCLLWIDSHGSHMAGMEPHFSRKDYSQHTARSKAPHPPPSKQRFITARNTTAPSLLAC